MSINGNGYDGYSMSNNARMAYEDCREMPLSKWTKTELLSAIKSYNVSADIILALQKHNTDTLRRELLMYSGWHHTSEYYNKTNFYAIDADKANELTVNCIDNWDKAENTVSSLKYRGDFNYVEWQGSRNYPKAVPHCLENVNIEERGSFYYVTDADDKLLIKKKSAPMVLVLLDIHLKKQWHLKLWKIKVHIRWLNIEKKYSFLLMIHLTVIMNFLKPLKNVNYLMVVLTIVMISQFIIITTKLYQVNIIKFLMI